MKLLLLGFIGFALCVCLLDAKDVRQISSLVPLNDWLEFKNRTRDVKPLDKFIAKLRATYDFVFHKAENVSNVGKILGMAAKQDLDDNEMRINPNATMLEKENASDVALVDENPPKSDSSRSSSDGEKEPTTPKLPSNRWLDLGFQRRLDKLESLEEAPPLSHLELLDDEITENVDAETLATTVAPDHSKFHLPYAIAQAFLRWLITLYYTTYNSVHTETPVRESA